MRTVWQDVRYGFRMLARAPGFTFIALISIALAIGVNTTIFSFVNAALFRPLPFPNSDQLVKLWDGMASSYPDYVAYRDESNVFSGLTAYAQRPMSLSLSGETERINGEIVAGNYFDVLGVRPLYGRGFLAEEDRTQGTHAVTVISHRLWHERFNSNPAIVGQSITINNHAFTVVGVMPENFVGATIISHPDLWIPTMMEPLAVPGSRSLNQPDSGWLMVMGRLKPDVNLIQAQAAVETIAARLHEARRARRSEPAGSVERVAQVLPARGLMPPPKGRATVFFVAGLVMTIVSLVLLVACANVSNMLLARASVRRKEIAVRLALGASRWRIVRQMLTESLLLALLGGIAGLLLAFWSADLFLTLLPLSGNSIAPDVSPDVRVLTYTLLLSIATGVVFGLVPALQSSKSDVMQTLKDDTSTLGRMGIRRVTLRNLLVVTQVAVSLLLLILAGLFIRNLRNTQYAEPGFEIENHFMMSFDLGLANYDAARSRLFQEQLMARVRQLPGVRAAALAEFAPLGEGGNRSPLYVEGESANPNQYDESQLLSHSSVGTGYFAAMGIPLVRGRDFNEQDGSTNTGGVIIINETLARRVAPEGDAIGKRIRMDSRGDYLEIIGIARDIKYEQLAESPVFFGYRPLAQRPRTSLTLHVRTLGDEGAVINHVRAAVRSLDPNLPLTDVRTMREHLRQPLAPAKLLVWLSGTFGVLALVLAVIGLYGVMTYLVSHRTREIGVRIALGAQSSDVLRLILREGLTLVGAGIIIGLILSFAATRVVSSALYGVSASDPLTFATVAALLVAASVLACYIPARRAMRVDPTVALRYE
jgi:macrolide transport system ATP-binding/permease protein